MDPRLLAATSQWRRQEQLRGLQPNHASTVSLEVAPLAPEGTLFNTCAMTLHPNEQFLAVGMTPFLSQGPSAVGIIPLTSCTRTSVASGFSLAPPSSSESVVGDGDPIVNTAVASSTRWLDVPARTPVSSLEWLGGKTNALLVGTTQGRILVAEQRATVGDVAPSSSPLPLKVVNTLLSDPKEVPVASIAVQPTNFAATTTVRCIRSCPLSAGGSLIAAACNTSVHVWDVEASSASPLLSIPLNSEEPETAICCAWGMSSHVVAVGGVAGTSFLVDKRQGGSAALYLPSPTEYAVRSIDLSHRVVPAAILMASSKGVLTIADARKPSRAVLTVDALQEMPVCASWMPHHPDLFTSAGMDGTVKVWCLRSRPNYVVGCARFDSPIAHMLVPRTYARTRILGMTSDGQLCTTSLTRQAMLSIAPNGLKKDDAFIAAQKGVPVTTPHEHAREEQRAEGLLYNRSFKTLMKSVLLAAKRREQRGDLDFALRVCSLVESKAVPTMDLGTICEQSVSVATALGALGMGPAGGGLGIVLSEGPSTLLQDIHTLSQRLPSTVVVSDLRGFERPDPDDPIRIDALKLNITMRKLLNACEVPLVVGATHTMINFLERRPDLVETDVLAATTRFLLQFSRRDGTAFVLKAMDVLAAKAGDGSALSAMGEDISSHEDGSVRREELMPQRAAHLLRALLLTTSEPLITTNTNVNPRKVRKIQKAFLGNLRVAKASVEVQLKVCDLDIKGGGTLAATSGTMKGVRMHNAQVIASAKAIVALVAKYQADCLSDESSTSTGVFTWLGVKPIMAYLRALLVCGSTVAFLWTAQQFLDVYAQYGVGSSKAPIGAPPILKCVNTLVEEELERFCTEATELAEDAEQLANAEEISVRVLGDAEDLLSEMHPFMLKVLRLAIECSNVAVTSDMPELPSLVKGIIEDLGQALGDCCDGWVALLSTLCRSRLTDKVKATCSPLLEELFDAVCHLRDTVALDNTCEHLMDTIVSTCESFSEAVEAVPKGVAKGRRR